MSDSDSPTASPQNKLKWDEYIRQVCESANKNEQEIIKFCLDSKNKIGKAETSQLTASVKKIVQAVTELGLRLSVMYGRLSEVKESKETLESTLETNMLSILDIVTQNKEQENKKPSYSMALKTKTPADKTIKSDNSVLIYPVNKNSGKKSEDIKEDLKKAINPISEGIKITTMRNLGDRGVLIRAENKHDVNALLESQQLKDIGLSVSRPEKRLPRLALYGVPSTMTEEQLKESLIKLNELTDDEVNGHLKVAFKFGRRDQLTCNTTVEVSPELRKKLLVREKLFLGWSACRVEDYTRVTRCFNCHGFGHISKTCKQKDPVCGHCADKHETKNCSKLNQTAICINCKKFGLPHNHEARDLNCPCYANAVKGLVNRTNYGF